MNIKNFAKIFTKKLWFTPLCLCIFCVSIWTPPTAINFVSKSNEDFVFSLLSSIISIIWSVCFLISWFGWTEIIREYMDNNKDEQNGYYINRYDYSGEYGEKIRDFEENKSCAAIAFFGSIISAIIFIFAAIQGTPH